MYLKKLEIQGFKSFPEKTVIEFHEGVTAIVGPNGSGKSNITDAIRWVLGEQSIKTLRGSKMEDVIFSGTQSRRAMGFAEVSIVIDNTDGRIPIEYSEISVSRRLYRSGESEYLINRTSCRLKDVLSMFMDTGIGRDGYSIVSQGRVDEILSHKSEDRRKVFEEASGIVKFKTRKEEAEKKLNTTGQNLIRINDIISELEIQIEPLEEQSKKAKQYLLHRDDLKGVEIALFLENIEKYTQKYGEYEEEYNSILKQINLQTLEIENMKQKNRTLSQKSEDLENNIENKKEQLQNINYSIKDIQTSIEVNKDKMESIKNILQENSIEGDNIDVSLKKLDEEIATRKEKEEYLNGQLKIYTLKLKKYEEEMNEILSTLSQAEKNSEEIKVRIDELTENLYDKRMQSRQTRGQIKMIETREETIANDIVSLISEQDGLRINKEECQEVLLEIVASKSKLEQEANLCKENLENSRKKVNNILMEVQNKRSEGDNLEYKLKTLKELEKSREGYNYAVKTVMELVDKSFEYKNSVLGTIGDLIDTDEKYKTAIEIALGSSVQNIVTDNESTASSLIEILKRNKSGRATFLPISTVKGRSPDVGVVNKAKNASGYIGFANEIVKYPAQIAGIVDYLLCRVIITDNLDNAINLAKKTNYSTKIVTLEGDVVNPGGALTGGYNRGKGLGVLGRSSEIERLSKKTNIVKEEIANLTSKLPSAEEKMKEFARALLEYEEKITTKEHERIREDSRFAQIEKDLIRCVGRIEMLKAEQGQLGKQKLDIDNEADALEKEAVSSENEIDKLKEVTEKIRNSSKEDEEQRDELRDMISNLKVSVNSIEESSVSAKEISERIEKEKQQYIAAADKREKESKRVTDEFEELKTTNITRKEKIQELTNKKTEEEAFLNELTSSLKELDSELSGFYDRFEDFTSEIGKLQSDLSKSEVKKGRMETALDEVKNRLWEQYELTYENAAAASVKIENAMMAQKKVNELRRLIKDLGSINVNAIEEYEKVSERYTFLVKQRDDIEQTKLKLMKVITEITVEMKKQFISQFRIINENFKTVFSELFGGGMAEITLGDKEDVLNCNIDINAQPPGKKLQNMLLLSGGERCLTAIALLFAILKLRPSPFCVLDEIEAALDDSNIIRFSEYIRNYTMESQFILVTHRKGTMEAADRLYGVTMQERGISKILSMKLSD